MRDVRVPRWLVLVAFGLLLPATGLAANIGVTPEKLIVVDKIATSGKAKVVYVAKDPAVTKGTGTDVEQISVRFDVAYGNGSAAGAFTLPAGASVNKLPGWVANKDSVAKYVNKMAPAAGPTGARVAVIKPGRLLKLVGRSLGDTPLDIHGAGDPGPEGVETAYCVTNGGEENCHCSAFTGCTWKMIAAGDGAKLVCKTGTADPTCAAIAPVCGNGVVEPPETCDPAVTCPASCDDGDACTTDVLTGSAATCDAACEFDPITTCQNGDGCCPAGCGLGNDDDCTSCFVDLGQTVLDTCTNLEWEKKEGADATPGSGTVDAGNLHDVDNQYSWAGQCTLNTSVYCQPDSAAAATCAAQTGGAVGCAECGAGEGTCNVDPFTLGAITTVWDWVNQVNAAGFAGHSDWRLATSAGTGSFPTGEAAELESIVDVGAPGCTGGSPCIDSIFAPTVANGYWSASSFSFNPNTAFLISFYNGGLGNALKGNEFWVRAVRPSS